MSVSAPASRLRAAVLSVGTEILLGDLTDSNATWVSARCKERGIDVVRHLAAGDDVDDIVSALHWLAQQSDIIIVGGGLGPTSDDRTREAIAAAAGVPLTFDEGLERAIEERFATLGRPMAPSNRRQAYVPLGAVTHPPVGTAPVFALDLVTAGRQVRVIALPGVPWELHALWDAFVVPQLAALGAGAATVTRIVHVAGRGESDIASIVEPLLDGEDDVVLAFLAKQQEIQVRLTATGSDTREARDRSQAALDRVVGALGAAVSGIDENDLESTVVMLLAQRGQRVATAESATAGSIAARLGRIPGASAVFSGGIVAYRSEAKALLAGLDPELVEREGAVSASTTRALALAARSSSGADWGLATTGVAGPSEVDGRAVGTTFWALAAPDGTCEVHERLMPGDRETVMLRLGSAALDLLRRRLLAV